MVECNRKLRNNVIRGGYAMTISTTTTRLILASESPRRAALMKAYGYHVEIIKPPLVEPDHTGTGVPAASQAEALSYFKARSVGASIDSGIIIAADTLAAAGRTVFGKPADRAGARTILNALMGTTHEVITGVTLLDAATGRRLIQHDTTAITMRSISDADLEVYLDTGAWEGKAGAYGIQDHGDAFVSRIDGSFTNVVGLPMELLSRMLTEWGITRASDAQTERATS